MKPNVNRRRGSTDAERSDRGSDDPSGAPGRLWLLAIGVLLVTMPAITLVVAYAALSLTQSVALERLTVVEAVELYVVELAMFAAFSYLLYRLTRYAIRRQARIEAERADAEPTGTVRDGTTRPGADGLELD